MLPKLLELFKFSDLDATEGEEGTEEEGEVGNIPLEVIFQVVCVLLEIVFFKIIYRTTMTNSSFLVYSF